MDPRHTIRSHLRLRRWPVDATRAGGFVYRGPADFVLREGRWWTPRERPAGLPQGRPRACYGNSIGAAALFGLRYVQGYAVSPVEPYLVAPHAWNADDDGFVLDLTWVPTGIAYLGVELTIERADDGTWNGDADPIDDFNRGWPLLRERWRGRDVPPDPFEPSPMLLALRARLAGDEDEARRQWLRGEEEARPTKG